MSKFSDQHYLKTEQYRDATNLNARIELHKRFSTNSYGWFAWVFDLLEKLPKQARVLELGCGAASMWQTCPGRIPVGWNITLSDLSKGMLESAKKSVRNIERAFQFEVIDAQSIPYDDESFDIVIANHMLYHVPERAKAIKEIRRVLRSPDAISGRSPDAISGRSPDAISGRSPDAISGRSPDAVSGLRPETASGKAGGHLIATTVGDQHVKELNVWLQRASMNPDFAPFSLPFTLESGLAQLQPYFQQVEVHRYEDSLQITEIEPLMAYIRSVIRAAELSESALAELRSRLERELQSKGMLFVTKDSGLFEVVK